MPSSAVRLRIAGSGTSSSASEPRSLAADGPPQLETLVPEYVTLPRGVRAADGIGGMVARPPVRVVIEPMRLEDLPAVHAIEQASFTAPWPPHAYRSELESNRWRTTSSREPVTRSPRTAGCG